MANAIVTVEAEAWDGPSSLMVKISSYGDADPKGFAGFYQVILSVGMP
jgi:hypothetical protein